MYRHPRRLTSLLTFPHTQHLEEAFTYIYVDNDYLYKTVGTIVAAQCSQLRSVSFCICNTKSSLHTPTLTHPHRPSYFLISDHATVPSDADPLLWAHNPNPLSSIVKPSSSLFQSISQTVHQWINQSINQSISRHTNRLSNDSSTHPSVRGSTLCHPPVYPASHPPVYPACHPPVYPACHRWSLPVTLLRDMTVQNFAFIDLFSTVITRPAKCTVAAHPYPEPEYPSCASPYPDSSPQSRAQFKCSALYFLVFSYE